MKKKDSSSEKPYTSGNFGYNHYESGSRLGTIVTLNANRTPLAVALTSQAPIVRPKAEETVCHQLLVSTLLR